MDISIKKREIHYYADQAGSEPFNYWLKKLKDIRGKAKINARINRAGEGNFGDYRHLSVGIYELKIDFGPGYRVYFGIDCNDTIILLIGGGTKKRQSSHFHFL